MISLRNFLLKVKNIQTKQFLLSTVDSVEKIGLYYHCNQWRQKNLY